MPQSHYFLHHPDIGLNKLFLWGPRGGAESAPFLYVFNPLH